MSASGSSALGDVDSFLKSVRCLVCGVPCHQLSLLSQWWFFSLRKGL
uniref:Uncharacterized protein n=1 Tax=Brassica campestris TaxID=3711 RepID=A0A3P6CGU1_BRACM|nr:unnamed protein product [Brassica rapa]